MNVSHSTTPPASFLDALERDLQRGTGDLPVLAGAAAKALRLAQSPNFDFDEVVKIAESDPPLAARFLGVANSALYYRGTTIRSIRAAIVRLGVQATRDVLYMAVYSGTIFKVPLYRDLVEATFRHSVIVARIARRIAELTDSDAEMAFLAGLLHDVGRARCLKLASRRRMLSPTREEVVAAADALHAQAGAALARAWHLPEDVAMACELHHEPGTEAMALRVAAADRLAHYLTDQQEEDFEAAEGYLELLGLHEDAAADLLDVGKQDAPLAGATR